MLRRVTIKGGLEDVMSTWDGSCRGWRFGTCDYRKHGAEMGATTSIFPADAQGKEISAAQGRRSIHRDSSG